MIRLVGEGVARVRQRRRPKPHAHLHTSPLVYAIWWTGLLLLHCANLGYYTSVSMLYNSLEYTMLYYKLQDLSIGIDSKEYPKIVGIHAVIAAIHAAYILVMVVSSIHARKLVFLPDMRPILHAIARHPFVGALLGRFVSSLPRKANAPAAATKADDDKNPKAESEKRVSSTTGRTARRASESLGRFHSKLFARDGILGVDSVYFDHILLVREFVETALQTYQLYRMTLLLPRLWLIRFYVALLVGNCWSIPILHRFYRHSETKRRMLCLLCDAVLDMLSSIGVSLIIFGTYVGQYHNPPGFPFIFWFDDNWLSNMQHEFEMMAVASWGDMISRLVFALGLLQCMDAIKEMLTPVASVVPHSLKSMEPSPAIATGTVDVAPPRTGSLVLPSVPVAEAPDTTGRVGSVTGDGPTSQPGDKDEGTTTKEETTGATAVKAKGWKATGKRVMHFLVHYVGPGLFVVWGCIILVIHLIAESHTSTAACDLPMKPWLSPKAGCSLVEINCYRLNSNGRDEVIAAAWDAFDPERAARVVVRHCPELVIDAKLKKYSGIAGFKVYNSTIIEWGDEGAVTQTHHSGLRSLSLVRTFVPNGDLPRGMLSPDFPEVVFDIDTSVTNIQRLPDDLDTIWHPGMSLNFELSRLTVIPDVVIRLKPYLISFGGCKISSVPAEAFELPSLGIMVLSMTQVQELPKNVTSASKIMKVLLLQNTNVTTFWSWMDPFITYTMLFPSELFNAYNTPYCRELLAIQAKNQSGFSVPYTSEMARIMDVSTPEKLAFALDAVDCSPGRPLHFPLPVEDGKHRVR